MEEEDSINSVLFIFRLCSTGDNLRMLMTFRPVGHRQHLLLPNLVKWPVTIINLCCVL